VIGQIKGRKLEGAWPEELHQKLFEFEQALGSAAT
jgi:hypothetical protein